MTSATDREIGGFWGIRRIRIGEQERGVLWIGDECRAIMGRGSHTLFSLSGEKRVTIYNRKTPWLTGADRDAILASGVAEGELETMELTDRQRGVARCDGRFAAVLGPGVHAWWKGLVKVEVAVKDIGENNGVIDVEETPSMFSQPSEHFSLVDVRERTETAFFRNGKLAAMLPPGRHAFWTGADAHFFQSVDLREQALDVNGQELLTADKLTLRLNAILTYRVADAKKSILAATDSLQALYRETQLAIRAEVGERDLDALLADKRPLSENVANAVRPKAVDYGLEVLSFGVKDIVLPGDVRALLLKATEAKKASEAATITRREETAAMRHQLNTAKMLADNPALMRLRELESVERIAQGGKLTVVMGEKGLAEKVADMM